MHQLKDIIFLLSLTMAVNCTATLDDVVEGVPETPDVLIGKPDVQMRIDVIRQEAFREDSFFAQGGTAIVRYHNPQSLPDDDRELFKTNEGETCSWEFGTNWPDISETQGEWPKGPLLNSGNIMLEAESAPGKIVLGNVDGGYYREQPEALDPQRHTRWFSNDYLPFGSKLTMTVEPGSDVGQFVSDTSLPTSFEVMEPDLREGTTIITGDKDLELSWTASNGSSRMVVLVKNGLGFVKCDLVDDGQASIPVAAMAKLNINDITTLSMQFWKEIRQKTQVNDNNNRIVEIDSVSRYVQFGRFDNGNGWQNPYE